MTIATTIHHLERLTEGLGRLVAYAAWLIMLLTLLVVIMRYGWHTGTLQLGSITISSIALQEGVMYLHAMLFMLTSAFTLKHNGHVRVDVFYRHFSARTRAWVDLLGSLLLLIPVSVFIAWTSWDFVEFAWRIKERSQEAEGLPWQWVLKALIPAMAATLVFQGLLEAAKQVLILRGQTPLDTETSHEGSL